RGRGVPPGYGWQPAVRGNPLHQRQHERLVGDVPADRRWHQLRQVSDLERREPRHEDSRNPWPVGTLAGGPCVSLTDSCLTENEVVLNDVAVRHPQLEVFLCGSFSVGWF